MLKKILILAAGLVLLGTGVAGAQQYPPAQDSLTADDTTVAPGEPIVLGMQVCRAGSQATFNLDGSTALGTATANTAGRATLTATIPTGTSSGSHTINGACTGDDGAPLTLVLGITVTAPAAAGTGLPTTGSGSTTPLTQLAVAALAGGGLLVLLANRRRTARTEARETAGV